MLSIVGRRNEDTTQSPPPPGMAFVPDEKERESESAGRRDVDKAK